MMKSAWSRLIADLPEHMRKLDGRTIDAIKIELETWRNNPVDPTIDVVHELVCFFRHVLKSSAQQLADLHNRHSEFVQQLNTLSDKIARDALLLTYAASLCDDTAQLAEDKKALKSRWFSADALQDRLHAKTGACARRIAVTLKLLGHLVGTHIRHAPANERMTLWHALDVETPAREGFHLDGAPPVRLAALICLHEGLNGLAIPERTGAFSAQTAELIARCAQAPGEDLWLQLEALAVLAEIDTKQFLIISSGRLNQPTTVDDIFLRRGILEIIATQIEQHPPSADCLLTVLVDPSPYVRQGLADVLIKAPKAVINICLPTLLIDQSHQVRAQALLTLGVLIEQETSLPLTIWLGDCLASENHSFVLRTALSVCNNIFSKQTPIADNAEAIQRISAALQNLHICATDLRVRRWAAESLLHLNVFSHQEVRKLSDAMQAAIANLPVGKQHPLPPNFDAVCAEALALAALIVASNHHGLDFERRDERWFVTRGHRFGFRLWRWLHELRHPSPDKRQAFRHTTGRIFSGNVHVPSGILAELAQTKVPGEPLHMSSEAGWRPYLPLPDELISCLDLSPQQFPLRIHTAEGVTSITPPASLWQRLCLRMKLIWRFADFAHARNWQEGSNQPAHHYVDLIKQQGFEVRFTPHSHSPADPAILRFFPAGFAASLADADLWRDFQTYFFSVYGNTLIELSLFACVVLVGFIARHIVLNRRMQRARKDIPLVIGGWGTRGKSGTERLKAALFSSMGLSVISKTTGCEAMFLHNHPYQPLREMFLFRPYDKATIWEQLNVTRLASELKADVLLWECMALTPSFVELLQQRWMRDDLSTITNTFPDHEDLQGPAGINIPEVMARFIPQHSTLITSEEQMRPILADAAKAQDTRILGVGWLESGLLTDDVLARFPYEEHPDNIALVVRMAAELGIPANFALKEMADRVVPDLGVLKVFPQSHVEGRTLTFANGMSANERFGCLGNWQRLGFDQIDMQQNPATLISTVVNNRADRVARSQVFASIVVNDVDADLHFLIGSNLDGLMGYIHAEWGAHVSKLSLWPSDGTVASDVLAHQIQKMRIPTEEDTLRARLSIMLESVDLANDDELLSLCMQPNALLPALHQHNAARADEIAAFAIQQHEAYVEYQSLRQQLEQSGNTPNALLDAAFRQQLGIWFQRKLIVVDDFYASGNQIIQTIAKHTPPGFDNHIMGIQNIKGTGLDFVYRWQAWGQCHDACADLRSNDPVVFRQGLNLLTSFQEYGLLTDEYVKESLAIARHSPHAEAPLVRAQLDQIDANMNAADQTVAAELANTRQQGWLERLVLLLEGFVDAGDAVRRRRTANRIYADLVTQRISHARATTELLKLTQKQKGGWLYEYLKKRFGGSLA